jgi:hypothetical protein
VLQRLVGIDTEISHRRGSRENPIPLSLIITAELRRANLASSEVAMRWNAVISPNRSGGRARSFTCVAFLLRHLEPDGACSGCIGKCVSCSGSDLGVMPQTVPH